MTTTSHSRTMNDDSGLMHLMEAATALTQLVSGSARTCTSTASAFPPCEASNTCANPISDDDDTMASKSTISLLRANHLKAMQAASLATGAQVSLADTVKTNATLKHTSSPIATSSTSKDIFPMKLHAILADVTIRDIISWLPHGNSFVIIRPDMFAAQVLPRYFPLEGSSKGRSVHKYPSFTRKLNRWGYRQISRGADAGAFYHELFRRDEPEACRGMVCQKSRKTTKDDCKSVSSASTMSMNSGEKRAASSNVTISTSEASARSLPFKKRRGIASTSYHESGIPSNVEMKPNNSSLLKGNTGVGSDADTVSNISACGSVSSMNKNKVTTSSDQAPSSHNSSVEAAAKETLARHFYEQHRAFALAALMENSRKAMLAAGMNVESESKSTSPLVVREPSQSSSTTTDLKVAAPAVTTSKPNSSPANTSSQHSAAAEAAKNALYKAYKKALATSYP